MSLSLAKHAFISRELNSSSCREGTRTALPETSSWTTTPNTLRFSSLVEARVTLSVRLPLNPTSPRLSLLSPSFRRVPSRPRRPHCQVHVRSTLEAGAELLQLLRGANAYRQITRGAGAGEEAAPSGGGVEALISVQRVRCRGAALGEGRILCRWFQWEME